MSHSPVRALATLILATATLPLVAAARPLLASSYVPVYTPASPPTVNPCSPDNKMLWEQAETLLASYRVPPSEQFKEQLAAMVQSVDAKAAAAAADVHQILSDSQYYVDVDLTFSEKLLNTHWPLAQLHEANVFKLLELLRLIQDRVVLDDPATDVDEQAIRALITEFDAAYGDIEEQCDW